MKRIFIAINLPKKIKKELVKKREEIRANFETDPINWVAEENLHITLAFLGSIKGLMLKEIERELQKIELSSFQFNLDNVEYIPSRKEAKMIWSTGSGKKINKLKETVDGLLRSIERLKYSPNSRSFRPHVTLGRVRSFQFKKQPLEEIPLLEDEFVDLVFNIESVDIMESKLKSSGAEYKKIKIIKLN